MPQSPSALLCSALLSPAGLAGRAGNGGGPLDQLRAMSRRIQSMQSSISGFLVGHHPQQQQPLQKPLQTQQLQHADVSRTGATEAAAGRPQLGPALADGHPHRRGRERAARGTVPASARAALPASAVAWPLAPAAPADLFTDDFILSMQLGADYSRLQQSALATAAAGAAQPGRAAGAVQRLKDAQRAVMAVRVGRQCRAA